MHADTIDATQPQASPQDLDMVDMPMEGIAAFWLSLKKIIGNKFTAKALADESERTSEPFIRHLLEIGPGAFPDDMFLRLARAKRDTMAEDLERKLALMRVALLDIAAGENPRKTLARMTAFFPGVAVSEAKVTKLAMEMVRTAENGGNEAEYAVSVSHRLSADQIMVKLMFYCLWSRRESKEALLPFAELSGCRHFTEALGLVADGFESPFIRERMQTQARGLLDMVRQKMDMATDMVLALRNKLPYEELYAVAKSYLPS